MFLTSVRFRSLSLLITAALLLGACASAPKSADLPQESIAKNVEVQTARIAVASQREIPDVATQKIERVVIKNASLTIVVDNPAKSLDTISRMAEEMEGYVVSANLYKEKISSGAEVPRASLTLRVPAERLNEVLGRIRAESNQEPINESINSQDVTSDYTDLNSRLRNLENAEAELTEIMRSATKTEEVLAVYNQLVQIREQIEVIKGQIKYYDESARLSAISVDLIANEAVQPLKIGGWQPVGVAKSALQALINALKFLANALIWIIIFVLPVLVLLFVVFYLPISAVLRAWKRHRKQAKPTAETSTSSNKTEG